MDNPDTDNTGYTIHRRKVSETIHITEVKENRTCIQIWTIQTPTTLGTQYTEQRIVKTEGAINNKQSRHQQHCVHNTQNNG